MRRARPSAATAPTRGDGGRRWPALPLSAPQYGMWAGQRLDPDSAAFWTAEAVELLGELDAAALRQALHETLAACDALHMRYRVLDEAVVQQRADEREIEIPHLDFSAADAGWPGARAWMARDLLQPVQLERGPLFATALLRLGPQRHLWYLRAHHIALDGFAYLLLIHRVAQAYSALRAGVAPAPARDWSLVPVIDEELRYRDSPAYAHDRRFWIGRLAGLPAPATLAPALPPSDRARAQRVRLPRSAYLQWQAAARACGVDWSAWLVAAIAAWLHARSGACDVSLGLLVMNRLGSAALGVPCMAMNVVPVRLRVDPHSGFDVLARTVADELRRIRPHQRYNYEHLRADLGMAGGRDQLYGPVVNLMPFDRGFVFAGLDSRIHPISTGAVDDLDITVSPLDDGVRFDFEANAHAYDAQCLGDHHAALLGLMAAAIQQPRAPVGRLAMGSAAHAGASASAPG